MKTYRLGLATVQVSERYTRTGFAGGGQIVADHAPQPGQAETARQYGLSVGDMNRTHDLAHSLLAAMLGLPASPTLRAVAQGERWPEWHREEAAVLALQGFSAAAGVDLEDLAARWTTLAARLAPPPAAPRRDGR